MKTKSNLSLTRKHIFKLIDILPENELHAMKRFAEFLKKARKENDTDLLQILENASYDEKELKDNTVRDIKKARLEFKEGKTYSLDQIKRELDI